MTVTGLSVPRAREAVGSAPKRIVDVASALVLIVLLAPVVLVAALAVRMSSPGPVLFRQQRLGRDGRPFVMLKLRSMYAGSPDDAHRAYVGRLLRGQAPALDGLYKLAGDPRVTRVGAFLRRSSIDEIPQLWNVVCGHMSLVGPRPVLPWEAELFPPWAARRFDVRPGITGLWQVSGRNRLSMLDGLALDVRYVDHRSLWTDLVILLRTVGAVLGPGSR